MLFSQVVNVEGKYIPLWKQRKININTVQNTLEIESQNKKKKFKLNSLNFSFGKTKKDLKIRTQQGRQYLINSPDQRQLLQLINIAQNKQQKQYQINSNKDVSNKPYNEQELAYQIIILQNNPQQTQNTLKSNSADQINHPNFYTHIQKLKNLTQRITKQESQSIIIQKKQEIKRTYKTTKIAQIINSKKWTINPDGGLLWIDIKQQGNIKKILVWLIKKVLKTGSFSGISLPVYVLKPESILQTYANCLGSAPIHLQGCKDKIQRIKRYTAILFSFSLQFTDLYKPFNPIIGQTFQGYIKGYPIYCQQVCHHPPITSILFYGQGYKIYGSIELDAKLGFNDAVGIFYGDLILQFDDKTKLYAKLMKGRLCNTLIGSQKFCVEDGTYIYDERNKIVANYFLKSKDIFTGYIGQLKQEEFKRFMNQLNTRDRFFQTRKIQKSGFRKIYSELQAKWSKYVKFDNIQYSNYEKEEYLPYELDEQQGICLLKSHCNNRKDIIQMKLQNEQNAQIQKQILEQIQRSDRKWRQKYNTKK